MPFCSHNQGVFDPAWSSEEHNFGQCFVDVFILGVPLWYLIVTGILTSIFLRKPRRSDYQEPSSAKEINADEDDPFSTGVLFAPIKEPWTNFELYEMSQTLLLAILPICEYFSLLGSDSFGSTTGSQFFTMACTSLGWIISAYYLYVAKRKQPLGPAWWGLPMFWTLMFLANSCKFYYYVRLTAYDGWFGAVTWFTVYFVLVGSQVLVGVFFRSPSPRTIKREELSREESSNLFSTLTFSWLNPILELGYKRPLNPEDLWSLANRDKSANLNEDFNREWAKEMALPEEQRSLVRTFQRAHGESFIYGGIFKFFHDILIFSGPFFLNQLIKFIGDPEEPAWIGYAIVFSMCISNLVQTALLHQYFQRCFRCGMNLRSSTIAAVYEKSLRLSIGSRQSSTQGSIVNLMAVDAQRFQDLVPYLHMLWSAPMQIALALYFLYLVLGPSIFAGFLLMVLMIPLNGVIASTMRGFQVKQMTIKDSRLKLLNEILGGIKVIKLYAWERSFLGKIDEIRGEELLTLRNASLVKCVTVFLWTSTPTLVSVVTFATFVAFGGELTSAKAFTAISLFNILRFPTNAFPMVLTSAVEASVSVKRLAEFLSLGDLDPQSVEHPDRAISIPFLSIEKGSFSWALAKKIGEDEKKEEEEKAPDDVTLMNPSSSVGDAEEEGPPKLTLENINMEVKQGELIALIGRVGSGKSSLVAACLGEIPKVDGTVTMCGSVGYVPQQAWIQNATLRDNVTFGQPFEFEKYSRVLEACCLEPDIAMLPGGDMTEVGEKGITLSGGQKQRLSLARAVYQEADVYLLDDPLSAVDAHVGRHIFENVLGPNGLLKDKVRLLVTHAEQYLPQCSGIYVMADGTFVMQGKYDNLVEGGHAFADTLAALKQSEEEEGSSDLKGSGSLSSSPLSSSPGSLKKSGTLKFSKDGALISVESEKEGSGQESDGPMSSVEGIEETESTELGKILNVNEDEERREEDTERQSLALKKEQQDSEEESAKLIQKEDRETGKVAWAVYWQYFKSLGLFNAFMIFLSFCIQQASQIMAQLWLARWTAMTSDADSSDDSFYYLGIYSALSIFSCFGVLIRSIALLYGSLRSSKNLHTGMMDTVMRSPMSFFDTTPLGRIVNRFSKDMYTVDESLPNIIGNWLGSIFYTISILIIMLVPLPYLIVLLIPVAVIFVRIQKFYLRSSREVQRLDSISRSPIYAHFSETLNGVSTIRSYDRSNDFVQSNYDMVDENQKAYFINVSSNRWLAVRLETVGTTVITLAGLMAVVSSEVFWNPDKAEIHASLVGLAISSALSVTQVLNWAVRMNCMMETQIVSVERIKEYTELEREAPPFTDTRPPAQWPTQGRIAFNNVQLRYREGLDLVLKGVSINVGAHEKVGIVGRTGAGKSTITLGLFRMVELAGGSITIDGVDISRLGLEDLRSRLSIIPQDPVLFSGTMRENLDPFQQHGDREIWEALDRAHLGDFVRGEEGQENMAITENGDNLSVGQRQLVCMARALLRKSPILVMDEATAAVDYQTDALIQETIRSEFKDSSVLTIAHRLNTIMDYDRIVVLGAGKLLEIGSPAELMENQRGHLARLVADSNKAQEK